MTKEDEICFNIWDDYSDGDDTYGYVESDMSEEDKERLSEFLTKHINSLNIPGVTAECSGEDVDFIALDHEVRESLVETLRNQELAFEGIKIHFYSES